MAALPISCRIACQPSCNPRARPRPAPQGRHLKAGTWGLLHVPEGTLRFSLAVPHGDERIVGAGETVVIESEVPHRVAFLTPGRMFVEFYQKETNDVG